MCPHCLLEVIAGAVTGTALVKYCKMRIDARKYKKSQEKKDENTSQPEIR